MLRLSLPLFTYVTILSLQGFHCIIIGLLRHWSVLVFDCLLLCFLYYLFKVSLFHYLFVTSLYYLFKVSMDSFHYRFITSLFCSRCSVSYTISSRFLCFIICL